MQVVVVLSVALPIAFSKAFSLSSASQVDSIESLKMVQLVLLTRPLRDML